MTRIVIKIPPAMDEAGEGYCIQYGILGPKALRDCTPLSEIFFHSQKIGVVLPSRENLFVRWMGGVPCEFLEEELDPDTLVTGLGSPEPYNGPHDIMAWNL